MDEIGEYLCDEPKYSNGVDFIAIFLAAIFVNILTLILLIAGIRGQWFNSLVLGPVPIWILELTWGIATVLSFIGLFLFYSHTISPCLKNHWPTENSRSAALAVLFLISSLLTLLWVTVFFYAQSLQLSMWLIGVVFIYQFWVFYYMWTIKPSSAIFMIPLLVMYVIVFYSIMQLTALNNITI